MATTSPRSRPAGSRPWTAAPTRRVGRRSSSSSGGGLPLAFTLTPGQRHGLIAFKRTLKAVRLSGLRGRPRTRPKHWAGDKPYSHRPAFAYLRRRRIKPVIPPRMDGNTGKGCPRTFDPDLYRRRNVIERCAGRLKGCRSVATWHPIFPVSWAAMVKLAFLRQYLRTLRPPDRT